MTRLQEHRSIPRERGVGLNGQTRIGGNHWLWFENFPVRKLLYNAKVVSDWQESVTPYAGEHTVQRQEWEVKMGISKLQYSSSTLTGSVVDHWQRHSSIDLRIMSCTCQAREIQRIPCACQMSLITKTGNYGRLSSMFVHPSFRTSSWKEAHNAALYPPSSSLSAVLIGPMNWLPPVLLIEAFKFPTKGAESSSAFDETRSLGVAQKAPPLIAK